MTAHDPRYTIHQEYTGEPGPRYVARFCLAWISSHDTAEEARRACDLHYRVRMPMYTADFSALEARVVELLRQRAQTAKRKMAQCVQLARSTSRYSWQIYADDSRNRAECHRISREAIEDARYWRDEIRKLDNQEPPL